MRILRVKNYEKYQNHRSKNPSWIKLYRSLLTDLAFMKLDIESRYLYIGLLILASETGNTTVNDASYLGLRLAIDPTRLDLKPLFRSGLLCASSRTVQRMNVLSERETERETEKNPPTPLRGAVVSSEFDEWWKSYPRKVGKEAAKKAWKKLDGKRPALSFLLNAVNIQEASDQWQKGFIPNPATWLNQHRWEDELNSSPSSDPLKAMAKQFVERGT